jgi:hypothetical protein
MSGPICRQEAWLSGKGILQKKYLTLPQQIFILEQIQGICGSKYLRAQTDWAVCAIFISAATSNQET